VRDKTERSNTGVAELAAEVDVEILQRSWSDRFRMTALIMRASVERN